MKFGRISIGRFEQSKKDFLRTHKACGFYFLNHPILHQLYTRCIVKLCMHKIAYLDF